MSLNVCTFMGRMVREPELKTTGTGVSVCSFCLAVDRNYTPKGSEKVADFIDFTAWRGTADFIAKYFTKGDMIAVTGELQTRMYEDKDGNKRKAVEVVVDKASFCGGKSDGNGNAGETEVNHGNWQDISGDEPLPF